MTPERESALEACAEALKELTILRKIEGKDLGYMPHVGSAWFKRKEAAWTAAMTAIERLDGLK
ncbi:MAG: hypothetical protein KDA17_05205 [Candidatus Saccharibacteria bacterium]|nr:hypothetical protein [Candidatus Saccharibacteria bacterium]